MYYILRVKFTDGYESVSKFHDIDCVKDFMKVYLEDIEQVGIKEIKLEVEGM